jgi:hypothetical protein
LFFQIDNLQQVHALQRNLFIAVIVGLFAVQAFMRFQSDIIQDAAWFIYVANQLLHGKTLYTDILEVNPPLGMWLIVPIVWLAEKINLDSVIAVDATLLAMSAGALWYCNRMLRFYEGISIQSRRLMLVFLALFILYFPASLFAEREHFMVLLFLPWLFLRIIPNVSTQLSSGERIIVGILAAAAICIKPQSVFAPVLVELVLLLRCRDLKSTINFENIAAVLFVIFYGASIFIFAPKFLTEMLTLGTKAYVPFFGYAPSLILLNALWAMIATLIAYLIRRRLAFLSAETRLIDGLLAAALGFIISYFIQMRGFGYQMMPADILANFAGVCAAVTLWQIERKFSFYILASLSIPAILLAGSPQTYLNNFDAIDKVMARNAPEAKSIFIASIQIGHGFPYVQQRNLVWASRFPTQWLAPYIESKWKLGQGPEDKITLDALDWTISDLIQFKPDIVMIDVSKNQFYIASGKFEYLKFWANDKRFADVWSNYKFRETVSGLDIFTRVNP